MGANTTETTLDVREIEGPPFGEITAALERLEDDRRLRLIASFEPVPLYEVLEERGFAFETDQRSENEWHVLIDRR